MPNPGDRIKIASISLGLNRASGTLVQVRQDTLSATIRNRELGLPIVDISQLEVQSGRHGHAVRGLVVGGLVGLVTVLGASVVNTSDGFLENDALWVEAVQMLAIPVRVGVGGIGGALIRGDTWEEIHLGGMPPAEDVEP
jgi:hypothetical protein